MTFENFKSIVTEKYPEARMWAHGKYAGNKINVSIVFNARSKVYQYNGTYCEVLNKLGIKAVYQHQYESAKDYLMKLKQRHGQINLLTKKPIDNSRDIAYWEDEIAEMEKDYIIV